MLINNGGIDKSESSTSLRKKNPLITKNILEFQKELLESLQKKNNEDDNEKKKDSDSSSLDVEDIYNNMDKNYYSMKEDINQTGTSGDTKDIFTQRTIKRGKGSLRKKNSKLNEVIVQLSKSLTDKKIDSFSVRNSVVKRSSVFPIFKRKKRKFLSCVIAIQWTQRLRIRIIKYGSTERNPKLIMKNEDNILTTRTNKSIGIATTKRRKRNSCRISAESKWIKFWNLFIFILLIYYSIWYLYRLCFNDPNSFKLNAIDYVIESFFLIDIIMKFFKEIIDEDGVSISELSVITVYRLKTFSFYLDIVSIFPFYLMIQSHYVKFIGFLKILRFFRPRKLPSFLSIINTSKYSSIIKIFVFIFKTFIICHFFACFWYLLANINNFDPDTWVSRFGFLDLKKGNIYIKSLYFSFTVFITVGYGDITPYSHSEVVIMCIWLLFCGLYYSFNLSMLGGVFEKENMKSIQLNNLMRTIKALSQKNHLSSTIEDKIKENVTKNFENQAEINNLSSSLNIQSIWNDLNSDLKYKIVLDIYQGNIINIKLLGECTKDFLANIIPLLEPRIYTKNTIIYKLQSSSNNIYFILDGEISHLTEDEIVIATISNGNYFGEIEIIKKTYRETKTITKKNSHLLLMNKKALYLDLIINDSIFLFKLIGQMMKRYFRYIKYGKLISNLIVIGKHCALKSQRQKRLLKENKNLNELFYNCGLTEILDGKISNDELLEKNININSIKDFLNSTKNDDKNDFEVSFSEEEKEIINLNVKRMKDNLTSGNSKHINLIWFESKEHHNNSQYTNTQLKKRTKFFSLLSKENQEERQKVKENINNLKNENQKLKKDINQLENNLVSESNISSNDI